MIAVLIVEIHSGNHGNREHQRWQADQTAWQAAGIYLRATRGLFLVGFVLRRGFGIQSGFNARSSPDGNGNRHYVRET